MAASYSETISVMGANRVSFGLVTIAGLTSGAVKTGLQYIQGGGFTYHSYTSAVPNAVVVFNRGSGSTAINGMVQIQTCTAGDDFYIYCIGE